ncbi:DNA primase [Paenibacillus illinoisensis]|uniref:DNA primase n=1 Tax=Paenibacillus illinoisensis TaxID=59845 RepID=UPI001C8D5A11|nr:DNA primase [Paenibacillus illinoisensis]MBY0217959.1 DNA primase [Paenibacillus illinoisensis]
MTRFISEDTINEVKNVTAYELAIQMGHSIRSSGTSWVTYCPNPNHGSEKRPKTYISKYKGIFKCFDGGGCGCKGSDSITYYCWSQYGEWDKKHFFDCILGIAEIMGIHVGYEDGQPKRTDKGKAPKYQPRPIVEDVKPQSDEVCDRVYRRFLSLCPVYEEHVHEWRYKRKYSDEEVTAIGLRSVPKSYKELNIIIRTLLSEGFSLERIPGFTMRLRKGGDSNHKGDWFWTISASGKYFIPLRNEKGQIIRLRVSTGREDKKYMWFSSAPNMDYVDDVNVMRKGGASSGAPLNIVAPFPVLQAWEVGVEVTTYLGSDFVICSEGEHKSYISSNILQKLFIGIPGVGIYKEVIPLLRQWKTKKLVIAMDMDALLDETKEAGKNNYVFEHLTEFAKQVLDDEGIEVVIWCWDPKLGKGLDDILLSSVLPVEIDLRTKERRLVTV